MFNNTIPDPTLFTHSPPPAAGKLCRFYIMYYTCKSMAQYVPYLRNLAPPRRGATTLVRCFCGFPTPVYACSVYGGSGAVSFGEGGAFLEYSNYITYGAHRILKPISEAYYSVPLATAAASKCGFGFRKNMRTRSCVCQLPPPPILLQLHLHP